MAIAEKTSKTLSADDLTKVLSLIKGSDSVELKLTVPETDQHSAIASLKMDAMDAQIRQVFFFDTPDLALYKAGVVARARRVQGKPADTVIKLRPVVPDELSKDLRKSPDFGVEVDAMPGGFVCSGTLKGYPESSAVRNVALGNASIRSLFSKEQRALYEANAPAGLGLNDLSILGPIFVLKLKFTPDDFKRRMVAELWLYPDNSRILELSTKCAPNEAFQTAAETRSFLGSKGIDLAGEQETKTRKALEFFAKRLKQAAS
jgi:hypothetical protein